MANKHGDFIWYELLTSDADAAQSFYGDVVGWSFKSSGEPGVDYRLIQAAGTEVGGVMAINAQMKAGGARPVWLGYVAVDDVDKAVAFITRDGGAVQMPAMDMPGVGRMAMVSDPQGAPFYVMRGTSDAESTAFAYDAPRAGHCAWNELVTSNPTAAMKFYGALFDWQKDGEMDMGPMGAYTFLRRKEVPGMFGAVMKKPAEMPVSLWTYYFRVPDIDQAVARAKARGGTILNGPMEIPGGEFTLNAMDPQGAAFALVGARK